MQPLKLIVMPCALFLAACNIESPLETASETGATDTATGETDATGEIDTGAPAECEGADPAVSIAWVFAFDAWDEQQTVNHSVDTTCVVGESSLAGGIVTTALSCELDGVAQPASLQVSATALDQDYVAGEQVKLQSSADDASEIDSGVLWRFTMRSATDDRLLVFGMRGEKLSASSFAPLVIADVYACGQPMDNVVLLRLDVSLPEGDSVGVFSGRSDVLDAGDGVAYTVAVQEASAGGSSHFDPIHHMLVRRVVVD